jgi:signal transduction histidine kinase
LRGILGYTREIVDSDLPSLPENLRESLNRIVEEAERLDTLIDSVRTLIQVQQISAEMKQVKAEELVQQGVASLQRRIEETGAQITISPGLPVLVANERWVLHAITNLIANAIKFTQPGERPQIEISSCPASKCGIGRGLVICDRGIGVPQEHRERIFELFKRAGNHDVEGTGAGLAIVAQIAKGHGGRAWVEEREGGGSAFYLVLGPASKSSSSGSNVQCT